MIDNPDIGAPAPAWKRLRFEATAAAAEEPASAVWIMKRPQQAACVTIC